MSLEIRGATELDLSLLARMNKHLIEDENWRKCAFRRIVRL